MVKLVNQTTFSAKIKDKNLLVFTATDVRSLFGLLRPAVAQLLHRYARRGVIVRLKRGLFVLADTLPPDLYLANKLYSPSYVSLEFALSYYGIIPETVYEITSVTTKATRRFKSLGKTYSYRKIRKPAFTGYTTEKEKGFSFQIADAEKAFVDTNYFRLLGKLRPISRYDKEKINPEKALKYASLFGNKKLISIIKSTLK